MSWYSDIKAFIANNITTNHARAITGAKMNTVLNDIVDEVDGKVDKVSGKGLSTNDYNNTEKAKVANAYSKPSGGIPKTDLASAVQTSLGKADTAVQTETDPTVPSWAKAQTKPTYTASEVGAIPATDKGANGGVATLDSGGKVPQSQLPSYVDDVLEYSNRASFPATGESGKIYVALDSNKTYRWSGSGYVEIAQGLALGETSSTAFAGDRGKAIEDKIPTNASSSNKLATMEDLPSDISELTDGKLYGGTINTQSTVQPDTSCYYIAEEGGTYQAFGVTVNANERVQIIIHNGTSWEVVSLNMYNYGYAHGKFDKVDDIDSLLTEIVPSSASSSNKLLTERERHFKGWFNSLAELKAAHTATKGDSAYVKDASPATTWSIYVYDATATTDNNWADSGTKADTSNVQTFASGEEVNEISVDKDFVGGADKIAGADEVKDIYLKITNRVTSYNDAEYIIRAVTGSQSLVDNTNGSRLRLVFKVKKGDVIDISSTFKSGYSCGIWDSPEHCVNAGTTGLLQVIVEGYTQNPTFVISQFDSYLGVSFSNQSQAIDDELKQMMLDSLTIYVGGNIYNEIHKNSVTKMQVAQYDKNEIPCIIEEGLILPSGSKDSSSFWRRYIFKNIGYNRVIARTYTSVLYAAIAFYNSEDIGTESLISTVVGLNFTQVYNVSVPNNCKTIVVCNWYSYLQEPTITLHQNNIQKQTVDVYDRISELKKENNQINDLMKDFIMVGFGDTISIKDIYSFIPGKTYRLSIDNPSWPINDLTISDSYNVIYINAYDENGAIIGTSLYNCLKRNYPCPQDIDFTTPSGTKFLRFAIRANTNTVIHFSVIDITLISNLESRVPIGTIEGIGSINLSSKFKEEKRLRYINQTIFDTTVYSVGVQSLAIYNDTYAIYGICATDKNDSEIQKCGIVIDDIANRTVLCQFEISTTNTKAHANNVNLGEKYDSNDVLPLLYVSLSYNTKECVVLRIANDFSSYTEIQKILYVGTEHFSTVSFDWILDESFIWIYGTYDNNSVEFVKFRKPEIGSQTVNLSDSDIIEHFVIGGLYIRQGAFIKNDKAYMGFGYYTGDEFLKVINLRNKIVETIIPLNYEPEGITIYEGKVCVCSSPYHLYLYSDAF